MTYFDYSVCPACHAEVGDGEFFAHRCPPDRPTPPTASHDETAVRPGHPYCPCGLAIGTRAPEDCDRSDCPTRGGVL